MEKNQRKRSVDLNNFSYKITGWVGTPVSIVLHSIFFVGIFDHVDPERFSFEDLVNELSERMNFQGKKILWPTQVETCHGMSQLNIKTWEIYKANFIEKLNEETINQIKEGIDIITFFSSNTAEHFAKLLNKSGVETQLIASLTATIGDETSKAAKDLFGRVDIIAEPFTEDGLISAMEKYFYAKHHLKIPSASSS